MVRVFSKFETINYHPFSVRVCDQGLGCGTPVDLANLQPNEVVVDLGCGAGFDCFLASDALQGTGLVIGVDMTPEMLSKGRKIAKDRQQQLESNKKQKQQKPHSQPQPTPVSLRLGEIEHLPVANACADVVISNCVVNLSNDKAQVLTRSPQCVTLHIK